ncbi:hypothetical protein SCLCIDRAFT_695400 [Scleroderma citrinum Foug A]|uniref:Uncharacterized protein n=1 Tax=Scleroderma citrinum Foug A TaxID=1036808 RepID=A0A0C3CQV6_9AGAM|nr:hypothetical protein SCLCIDRAFT_695400 [Scleroderma citrinum Foug A]
MCLDDGLAFGTYLSPLVRLRQVSPVLKAVTLTSRRDHGQFAMLEGDRCALPESTRQRRHSKFLSFFSFISFRNASSSEMASHHGQGYLYPHGAFTGAMGTSPSIDDGSNRISFAIGPTDIAGLKVLSLQSGRSIVPYPRIYHRVPRKTSQVLVPPFPNSQRCSARSPNVSYSQCVCQLVAKTKESIPTLPHGTHSSDGFHSPPPPPMSTGRATPIPLALITKLTH